MGSITLHRVVQHDGHLRKIGVFVDKRKVADINSGQTSISIELDEGKHHLYVSLTPFYRSSEILLVSDKTNHQEFYVGFFYRHLIEGFSPRALRVLSKETYLEHWSKTHSIPRLSSTNMTLVVLAGILSGLQIFGIYLAGNNDTELFRFLPMFGIASVVGGIAAIFFNKSNSIFPYHKPFLDAFVLFATVLILDLNDIWLWSTLTLAVGLTMLGLKNWKHLQQH